MDQNNQLVFGLHGPADADGKWKEINTKSVNPCVNAYGLGPREKMCKTCAHIKIKTYSRNFYKCDLRANTNGPGTDHRLFWPACAKYEEAKPL